MLLPLLGERAGVRASVSSKSHFGRREKRPRAVEVQKARFWMPPPSAERQFGPAENIEHPTSNIEHSTPTNTSALNSQGAKTPRRGGKEPTDVPMKQCQPGCKKSRELCVLLPLLGERAGVRASVSPTHFRSRRRTFRGEDRPGSASLRRRLPQQFARAFYSLGSSRFSRCNCCRADSTFGTREASSWPLHRGA